MPCNPQGLDLLSNVFAELAGNSHVTRLAHPTDGLALPFHDGVLSVSVRDPVAQR